MTPLGKVVRTTAFKLSAIYIAVFTIFAVAFVLYISYSTNELLTQQLRQTIAADLSGLADQARAGGLAGSGRRHRDAQPPARRQPLSDHRRLQASARRQRLRRAAEPARPGEQQSHHRQLQAFHRRSRSSTSPSSSWSTCRAATTCWSAATSASASSSATSSPRRSPGRWR